LEKEAIKDNSESWCVTEETGDQTMQLDDNVVGFFCSEGLSVLGSTFSSLLFSLQGRRSLSYFFKIFIVLIN